jgi:SAM-dependent methyltransferase
VIRVVEVDEPNKSGIFGEHRLARDLCRGIGIELGAAAHNPFNLTGSINVAPKRGFEHYKQKQVEICGAYAEVDLWGDAANIPVGRNTQDYVISSHVVEHVPDVVAAFEEWNRILKPEGIVFMIWPSMEHVPPDLALPMSTQVEIAQAHLGKRTLDDVEDTSKHRWQFDVDVMTALIAILNAYADLHWRIISVETTDSKVGNGQTMACRYSPPEQPNPGSQQGIEVVPGVQRSGR